MAYNPWGTILICLTKTTLAGLASGFLFKLFKRKAPISGIYVCSIIVPIINTGIFTIGCFTTFKGLMTS